jgi:hypothetical protein
MGCLLLGSPSVQDRIAKVEAELSQSIVRNQEIESKWGGLQLANIPQELHAEIQQQQAYGCQFRVCICSAFFLLPSAP